jgi:micrococcal nuclease
MENVKKSIKIDGISIAGVLILFIFISIIALLSPNIKYEKATKVQSEQSTTTSLQETGTQLQPDSTSQVKSVQTTETQGKQPAPTSSQETGIQSDSTSQTKLDSAQTNLVKVVSVVDGDTIKVSINGTTKTVRLIGIDTPETVDPRKPVQCFGKEASDKAKATLLNKMVRLESDPTQGDLDKYQRLLKYVFLEDGTFFNKFVIEQGYAHEYTYEIPYKYQSEFKAAEKTAREAQLGLWNPGTCNGTTDLTPGSSQIIQTQPTQPSGHIFYLSTYHTSRYYYCDTDEVWKSLSTRYLKSYSSEQALLKDYPSQTLHEACK